MALMMQAYQGKLAVLYPGAGELQPFTELAARLDIPLRSILEPNFAEHEPYFLTWRDGCLKLLDHTLLKKGGLYVEIMPRPGEQRSWPAPKEGALAQAIGRKTKTVVDATTGWGQDSLHMFRMGYELICMERSVVMAELLADGLQRLSQLDWLQNLKLPVPQLQVGNAIELLTALPVAPDCIYLDPMFPPKRKKSALAKKSMQILRELVGDDPDKEALFAAALAATGKRVVVKCPDHAEPLSRKPDASFGSKLLRYDVYFKPGMG